mmetsp:Transcript_91194/g.232099  ORF Transcript_91194/g.232099 Transcript_91194/m.232099 type:complete len:212 (+) Transcript_91194:1388-2023(+)
MAASTAAAAAAESAGRGGGCEAPSSFIPYFRRISASKAKSGAPPPPPPPSCRVPGAGATTRPRLPAAADLATRADPHSEAAAEDAGPLRMSLREPALRSQHCQQHARWNQRQTQFARYPRDRHIADDGDRAQAKETCRNAIAGAILVQEFVQLLAQLCRFVGDLGYLHHRQSNRYLGRPLSLSEEALPSHPPRGELTMQLSHRAQRKEDHI